MKGKGQEYALCEVIDQDGDKWYAEAHGDGTKGTYTAPHGTGKYEGMTLQAEYRFVQWPAGPSGTFRACNPNRGTYKIR